MKRALVALIVLLGACAEAVDTTPPPRPATAPPLALTGLDQDVLLPGTVLILTGSGFVNANDGSATVTFQSEDGVDVSVAASFVDATHLELSADDDLLAAMGGFGNRFDGQVTLAFTYTNGAAAQSASVSAAFDLRQTLTPTLQSTSPAIVYLGSTLSFGGSGFLSPEEGGTTAVLSGTFTPEGGAARAVQTAVKTRYYRRDEALLEIAPDLFGISPGTFEGTVFLRNTPLEAAAQTSGSPRALALDLGPAAILGTTLSVRRGQKLVVRGRGFLAKKPEEGQATVLMLQGDFTPRSGPVQHWNSGAELELVPETDSSTQVSYLLRVSQLPSGDLTGLGLVPGAFVGKVIPLLLRGGEQVTGLALDARIEILPQRQVVYLHYLPGFTDALRRFGLRNVELMVRARILEVCKRDYARWNVEFRETRPTDYVEYQVVELAGVDPNGQNLFGLDNTTGKDLGNLRFNDVIGGFNAETEEQGFLAYGGVFLESFLGLSPTSADPLPIAHPLFDEIFDPLREERGGVPVTSDEYPFTGRKEKIEDAVRVLGNLIGTTVTHEIGHTLGLATAEGYFHNPDPGPNQIMDSGDERPFEERAELNGFGPAEFEPWHIPYLDKILPPD